MAMCGQEPIRIHELIHSVDGEDCWQLTEIAVTKERLEASVLVLASRITIIGGRPVKIGLEDKTGQDQVCPDQLKKKEPQPG